MRDEAITAVVESSPASSPGAAAQWGLAALLLGGVLLLAALVALIFNVLLWKAGPWGINLPLAYTGALVGLTVVLGLTVASVAFGLRGWLLAVNTGQTPALAVAGTLASFVALVLWLLVGTDLVMILISFRG